jgi:hypothetical protein
LPRGHRDPDGDEQLTRVDRRPAAITEESLEQVADPAVKQPRLVLALTIRYGSALPARTLVA